MLRSTKSMVKKMILVAAGVCVIAALVRFIKFLKASRVSLSPYVVKSDVGLLDSEYSKILAIPAVNVILAANDWYRVNFGIIRLPAPFDDISRVIRPRTYGNPLETAMTADRFTGTEFLPSALIAKWVGIDMAVPSKAYRALVRDTQEANVVAGEGKGSYVPSGSWAINLSTKAGQGKG